MRAAAGIVLGALAWLCLGSCAGGQRGGHMAGTMPLSRDAMQVEPSEYDTPAIDGYEAFKRKITARAAAEHPAPPGSLPEELLLDVGIAVFQMPAAVGGEPGGELAEVRRAEGNYLPGVLKKTLQHTGQWGAVRVVPRASAAVDVAVVAVVEQADGDTPALRARVRDVRGATWFERRYRATADATASRQLGRPPVPFEVALTALARDMTRHLHQLQPEELVRIRTVGALRYADRVAPSTFARYLAEDERGEARPVRLPAVDDPLFASTQRIRDRERMFIDTADEYFAQFNAVVSARYHRWLREAHDGAAAARALRRQARSERLLGAISVVAGLALLDAESNAGQAALTSVASGVGLLRAAARKDDDIRSAAEQLRHAGERAGAEMLPHTIALENQTDALEHDVQTRTAALRRILRHAYEDERGQIPPTAPAIPAPRHFAPLQEAPPASRPHTPLRARAEPARQQEPRPPSDMVRQGLAAAVHVRAESFPAAADDIQRALAESSVLDTACTTVCAAPLDVVHRAKRSRRGRVRQRVFLRLADARQLGRIDAAAAAADLRGWLHKPAQRRDLNDTELARLHDVLAGLYLRLGDVERAKESLEQVVARLSVMPRGSGAAALYQLALLHFEAGDHQQSMHNLKRWLARSELVERACPTVCPATGES